MSIFSNFKINSLRKKIEGSYESRLERVALSLKNLPEDQEKKLILMGAFALNATVFAKTMNYLLFHPDSGVFRNDIGNLNDLNFDKLYEIMVVWFMWTQIPLDPKDEKKQESMDFCINSLETWLGINPLVIQSYYTGLAENTNLVNLALYRWCMLTVGHIDINYEVMHGNSPDCQKFIEIVHLAKEQAENYLNKK